MKMTMADVKLTVRARAFSGRGLEQVRVMVEPDGTIRVWDSIAGHYTTCHSLTPSAERRIRKLAAATAAGGREMETVASIRLQGEERRAEITLEESAGGWLVRAGGADAHIAPQHDRQAALEAVANSWSAPEFDLIWDI